MDEEGRAEEDAAGFRAAGTGDTDAVTAGVGDAGPGTSMTKLQALQATCLPARRSTRLYCFWHFGQVTRIGMKAPVGRLRMTGAFWFAASRVVNIYFDAKNSAQEKAP